MIELEVHGSYVDMEDVRRILSEHGSLSGAFNSLELGEPPIHSEVYDQKRPGKCNHGGNRYKSNKCCCLSLKAGDEECLACDEPCGCIQILKEALEND